LPRGHGGFQKQTRNLRRGAGVGCSDVELGRKPLVTAPGAGPP
jgi:hypothetical protein